MADVLGQTLIDRFRVAFGALCCLKTLDLAPRLAEIAPVAGTVAVTVAWVGASVAVTIGWRWREACLVLSATVVGSLAYGQVALWNQHFALIAYLAGFLALLDQRHAMLAVRIQASVVYGAGAAAKVTPWFLDGSVLEATAAFVPEVLLLPAAWAAVATEAFLALALWLPRTRRLAIVVGIGFHIGIVITMTPGSSLVRMLVFNGLLVAMYLAFLPSQRRLSTPAPTVTHAPSGGRGRLRRTDLSG